VSACLLPLAAHATASADSGRRVCGVAGYSYAGFLSPTAAYGVSGRLKVVTRPRVAGGHVAAWIGVGGAGQGPGGSDAWAQVGISGFPDGHSELYYEFKLPSQKAPRYVSLGRASTGRSYDVSLAERPARRNAWSVTVNGKAAGPTVVIPGSHGTWRPVATSESWDGGTPVCNRFEYEFSDLATARSTGGDWQPFGLSRPVQDPGYRVSRRLSGFAASAAV
jgi:hypothetical protein